METNKTLISRTTLAERWDFETPSSIINYENEGLLTRNPNFKKPKYYMEEVLKIEALKEVNPLSPLERIRLEKEIEKKDKHIEILESKLSRIKELLIIE